MTEITNDEQHYVRPYHQPVDKEQAEMRMMGLIDRMEKWNNQKKASK